jgi:hypothetical protein
VPEPQRVRTGARRSPAGVRVAPRWRVRDRARRRQPVLRRASRGGRGRGDRDRQLPARQPRLAQSPRPGRRPGRAGGELGPARPDRCPGVGKGEHRCVRRGSGRGDARRSVGGGAVGDGPARRPQRRAVPPSGPSVTASRRRRAGAGDCGALGGGAECRGGRYGRVRRTAPARTGHGADRGASRRASRAAGLRRDPRWRAAHRRFRQPSRLARRTAT